MILFGIFLAIIIFSIHPCRKETGNLPKERTNVMRGIMALSIVFHHMADSMLDSAVLLIFVSLVGPFYFLSAYGLTRGYLSKENYMNNFFRKRFSKAVIPFLLVCVTQSVLFWCIHGSVDIGYVKSAANYWFVHSILIIYVGFWICFRQRKYCQLKIVIFLALYVIMCKILDISSVYYGDVFAFGFGVIYAENEEKIEKFILKHYWVITWISIIVSLICYTYIHIILPKKKMLPGLGMVAWFIQSISYCVIWISLIYRMEFKNRILGLWGELSYELYLAQGSAFLIINCLVIENKTIIYLSMIILCTIFAWLLHRASFWISRKLLQR